MFKKLNFNNILFFILIILIIFGIYKICSENLNTKENFEPICSEDTEVCKLKNFIDMYEKKIDENMLSNEKIKNDINDRTEIVINGYRFAKKLYKMFLLSKIDGKTYEDNLNKLLFARRSNLSIKEANDIFKRIENDYNIVKNNYESNTITDENETSFSSVSNIFSQ